MQESRVRLAIAILLVAFFSLIVVVITLVERPAPAAPTPDLSDVQTEAVAAFIAELTSDARALPSPSPTRVQVSTPTGAIALSGTPGCLGLRFVRDVTIPDNMEMTPAEVFTKTWMVENGGTCPWKPGFQVVLIGGLAMGGSPFKVAQTVGPGGSIQVSIKMAAPVNETGVVQGTWIMTDLDGVQFGEPLWVTIVITGPTRVPAAATATP